RHARRTEIWTCTEGCGKMILEGEVSPMGPGDVVSVRPGMRHAIKADTELHIIEVQIGDELTEEDIERLDWDWSREDL
ncbi:MAG: cupin domain-containing protein, partial [Lachnospiraceae bacterium]|nr:cupin domain-containing protein [Lachnospiraceae bacterium]